jgi:hypothetical protein
MYTFSRAAIVICAWMLFTSASAVASDRSDALTSIEQLVAAWNKGDDQDVVDRTTKAPAIIDEFPPYHWEGPTALADWNRDYQAHAKEIGGVTESRVDLLQPAEVDVHGDTAYAVIPTTYRYISNAKRIREGGILTAALRKIGGTWRVAAFAWSNQKVAVPRTR